MRTTEIARIEKRKLRLLRNKPKQNGTLYLLPTIPSGIYVFTEFNQYGMQKTGIISPQI